MLEHFRESDANVVGLGHEPDQKQTAVARLTQINPEFNKVTWTLVLAFQTGLRTNYVE